MDKFSIKELLYIALIFHDIGKKETIKIVDGETEFKGHEEVGAEKTKSILEKFSLTQLEKDYIVNIIKNHSIFHNMMDKREKEKLSEAYINAQEKHREVFIDLLVHTMADRIGGQLNQKNQKNIVLS